MEITPYIFICLMPLLWTGLVFWLGRLSARYNVRFEPRERQATAASPYQQQQPGPYANFQQEQ